MACRTCRLALLCLWIRLPIARRDTLRQFRQQPTETWLGIADTKPLVYLPRLANRRVHDRHVQILLKHFDHAHHLPAAALDVDAIGIGILTIKLLDVRVERFD